jgi:hypothetical protein
MATKRKSKQAQEVWEEYGYSNDEADIASVRAFVAAAIADGWHQTQYYDNEPVDQSCKLSRDGFKMSVLTRDMKDGSYRFWASVSAWGPDGMSIRLRSDIYNGDDFKAGLRRCCLCAAEDVDTEIYSFAGRCCKACLPAARAQFERPGWSN